MTRHVHVGFGWLVIGIGVAVACESSGGGLERPGDSGGDDNTSSAQATTGGNGGSAGGVGNEAGSAGQAGADNGDEGGSDGTTTSTTASASTSSGGTGASGGTGGSGTTADSGSTGGSGTTAGSGGTGSGGAGGGGTGGGGTGGSGGEDGVEECIYHSEPSSDGTGGQTGEGYEDVHLGSNGFIGSYLVDAAGMSLYIYGADFPGDCDDPPITNCADDCLLSWPVFDAGARSLGYPLSDEAFGSFQRPDGAWQTTYLGWPLYYYKNDLLAGDLTGQAKGRTWLAAELVLPNILVMRSSEETGGLKYLSTDRGFTLYAYAGDTLGTPDMLPASNCLGECLEDYQPFVVHQLRPSSAIEPQDLTVFVRPDTGELQLAYKGKPLYASSLDERSGDLNGIALESWGLVEL